MNIWLVFLMSSSELGDEQQLFGGLQFQEVYHLFVDADHALSLLHVPASAVVHCLAGQSVGH